MQYLTHISVLGLCANIILADPLSISSWSQTSTSTTTITTITPGPKDAGFIGLGTADQTNADHYSMMTCESGKTYYTSNSAFGCRGADSQGNLATSCGGKATPTLFHPNGVQKICDSKETCHTNIVLANKDDKHGVTGYQCRNDGKPATYTLYRSDPPSLKNDHHNSGSGSGGQVALVGAVLAGSFALGMAVIL